MPRQHILPVTLAVLLTAVSAHAQVTIAKVACPTKINALGPNCYKLSNGTVDVVVATDIGPRVIHYGFVGGENILGEVKGSLAEKDKQTWQAWGGHRVWIAPEGQPKSYGPDNSPIKYSQVGPNAVRLEQLVEPGTGIQKSMTVTLDATGSGVTVLNTLTNRNQKPYELAVWALTIMNPVGGTAIIPQEPYASHDNALLPARPLVMWSYTNLTDPRWTIGQKYLRLSVDPANKESQKIGVGDKVGWVAYARNGLLFVKRLPPYQDSATYPDYGSNVEVYTAADFLEVESLGPMRTLKPGESAEHTERWSLHRDVTIGKTTPEKELDATIGPLMQR